MEFTIAERTHYVVRFLAKKKGITQAQVGELIGYSNKSSFSAVLSGRKEMPKKFGAKLAALDPEINPAFLTGESDDMLLNADEQPAEVRVSSAVAQQKQIQQHEPVRPGSIIVPPELAQMFTDLSATIRSQQETIQMLLEEKRTSAKVG